MPGAAKAARASPAPVWLCGSSRSSAQLVILSHHSSLNYLARSSGALSICVLLSMRAFGKGYATPVPRRFRPTDHTRLVPHNSEKPDIVPTVVEDGPGQSPKTIQSPNHAHTRAHTRTRARAHARTHTHTHTQGGQEARGQGPGVVAPAPPPPEARCQGPGAVAPAPASKSMTERMASAPQGARMSRAPATHRRANGKCPTRARSCQVRTHTSKGSSQTNPRPTPN